MLVNIKDTRNIENTVILWYNYNVVCKLHKSKIGGQRMRRDLKHLDMERLNEMRQIMAKKYLSKGPNCSFWDELEIILQTETESHEWVQKPKGGIILGNVWECPIGKFYHRHTVHIFAYLYAEYDPQQELVIDSHDHKELFHGGKQVKKIKEWYIFPDGTVKFCDKDEFHQLINDYGKSIYVISVKSMSKATH